MERSALNRRPSALFRNGHQATDLFKDHHATSLFKDHQATSLLRNGHQAKGVPCGIGVDPPFFRSGVENRRERAPAGLFDDAAGLCQILNQQIEMRLMLAVSSGPPRRHISLAAME